MPCSFLLILTKASHIVTSIGIHPSHCPTQALDVEMRTCIMNQRTRLDLQQFSTHAEAGTSYSKSTFVVFGSIRLSILLRVPVQTIRCTRIRDHANQRRVQRVSENPHMHDHRDD